MTLPRSSNPTSSSTTPLPRTSSDIGMAEGAAALTPPPPLSACMPATSLNTIPGTHSATKSSGTKTSTRWLPHILPIDALDASFGDNKTVNGVFMVQSNGASNNKLKIHLFRLPYVCFTNLQDPEEGVEMEEDLALDDRKLPLAYNHLRHQESICGVENESQVYIYK